MDVSDDSSHTLSQKERILRYLHAGNHITPLAALSLFGCLRLGARIWDLKQEGYNIHERLVDTDTGKHVSEYWLPREERLRQTTVSMQA